MVILSLRPVGLWGSSSSRPDRSSSRENVCFDGLGEQEHQCPRLQDSREHPPDNLAIVVAVGNHHRHRIANQPASLVKTYFLAAGFVHDKDRRPFGFQGPFLSLKIGCTRSTNLKLSDRIREFNLSEFGHEQVA